MRQSTKTGFTCHQGFHAFLPCRAAAVVPDPHLRGRDHPPPPEVDRLGLEEAQPGEAGPPGPSLPAERRDIRRAGGRVRGRHCHGVAVRERDRRPAGRPRPEAPQGRPGREEGRARLRRHRRHPDPHRPGCRGPALLLRQAQEARDEPAGHRQSRRRHLVGVRGTARLGARQEGRVDLGRASRAGGRGPGHPGRQGLPGQHVRENPVQGQEQAGIPETGQHSARETPLTRGKGERPAQDLENPR